jgi:hypothetical protein
MGYTFETLGNATVQIFKDQRPILATDPWLTGTCYFGSWALDKPLTDAQIASVLASDYVWISHGHPDHLHGESLDLLPRGKKILLPDHYHPEIKDALIGQGFDVRVMPYKTWMPLGDGVRAMCLDNQNQDAMLIVEVGDALLINQNDSPLCGEAGFLRRLVRRYRRENTYLLALCAIDADMLNFVDANDQRVTPTTEALKPGKVHEVSIRAAALGVGSYCCSSSQHIYVRKDSVWANEYRVTWADMQAHWSRPRVRLIEPFVTVDLATGAVTRNHPTQTSNVAQITDRTADDDWSERLTADEWAALTRFMTRFELLGKHMDFVEFTVGGETRRIGLNARGGSRGVRFAVPRRSLMATVECGYFDDLLIGNFMRTETKGMRLYPHFSPLVGKAAGNAKVFTARENRQFHARYFRRAPLAYLAYHTERAWRQSLSPFLISVLANLGIKEPARRVFRMLKGVPALLVTFDVPDLPALLATLSALDF